MDFETGFWGVAATLAAVLLELVRRKHRDSMRPRPSQEFGGGCPRLRRLLEQRDELEPIFRDGVSGRIALSHYFLKLERLGWRHAPVLIELDMGTRSWLFVALDSDEPVYSHRLPDAFRLRPPHFDELLEFARDW